MNYFGEWRSRLRTRGKKIVRAINYDSEMLWGGTPTLCGDYGALGSGLLVISTDEAALLQSGSDEPEDNQIYGSYVKTASFLNNYVLEILGTRGAAAPGPPQF